MTKFTIKYRIRAVAVNRRASLLRGLFSNNPNLLKRDNYPSTKLQRIFEIRHIWVTKNNSMGIKQAP